MDNIVVVTGQRTLDVIVREGVTEKLRAAWTEVAGRGQAIEPADALYEFPDQRGALHILDLRDVRAISIYPLEGKANG